MKRESHTPLVLTKLGFYEPIGYDVKTKGELVVIDRSDRKLKMPTGDYENLLDESP